MEVELVKKRIKQFNIARGNLILMAGITLINLILFAAESDFSLLFTASLPLILFLFERTVFAFILVGAYIVLWVLSKKMRFFMPVALGLFIVDVGALIWLFTLVEFDASFLLNIAFAVWISFYLIIGTRSWFILRKLDPAAIENLFAEENTPAGAQQFAQTPAQFQQMAPQEYQQAELITKAQQGDAEAQYDIAWEYKDNGDIEKFAEWIQKCVNNPNIPNPKPLWYLKAMWFMGDMYQWGASSTLGQDMDEALKWYEKAADLGHKGAQYSLADYYLTKSEGGTKVFDGYNHEKILDLFIKSGSDDVNEKGRVFAQFRVGFCYKMGFGTPENVDEAIKWFKKAAEQNDAISQWYLGNIYLDKGYDENKAFLCDEERKYLDESAEWYARAIKNNSLDESEREHAFNSIEHIAKLIDVHVNDLKKKLGLPEEQPVAPLPPE